MKTYHSWAIQDGKGEGGKETGKKAPDFIRFTYVTSPNVGNNQQNFLAFRFNPCVALQEYIKVMPSTSPKLLSLNQDHLSKKLIKNSRQVLIK